MKNRKTANICLKCEELVDVFLYAISGEEQRPEKHSIQADGNQVSVPVIFRPDTLVALHKAEMLTRPRDHCYKHVQVVPPMLKENIGLSAEQKHTHGEKKLPRSRTR